MKTVILGGGVIGVTTAHYLAGAGHEVVVIERQPATGLETSFANAGEVSPGYSAPWAAPGVPVKALKWLAMKHGPLVVRPHADPAQWRWMAEMLMNCTEARYRINKARMVALAEYSRDCLIALRAETGIAYDERARGTLQMFRTQKDLDGSAKDIAVLKESGVPFEVLDRAGVVAAEPALGLVSDKITGGLRLPNDETGDCHMFTQRLAELARERGVRFMQSLAIHRLVNEGDRIAAVETSEGKVTGDRYVVALGSYSPLLMKTVGIRVPVYPVKGYSLTLPITDETAAPVSTVMDETYKIAITRLGDRIRVGGTAELDGYNLSLRDGRRRALEHSVGDLFPRGGDLSAASFWAGLRPMTPDGTPLIGATRYRNLHLNTGHGTLGWTMACGSGRLMADLLSGRAPDIDPAPYGIGRGH
ncbi:D-amino acid dehydrogenase [Phreatobacter aquaticus]|uniref:D-amino acid dehydrogenase n=1 Tax=Phreatobacter aquaticus TaxID=2570229 RepID=A0A4D7QL12_9HYPH|nr:D-amino acid dehydrogenase [Phreatobacter aquaticus]QCK87765.1 D-amino acid dehydrogenase [Phreatobacter aquaticus]